MSDDTLSKKPTPDAAEYNAFFPSPFSLSKFTSPTTDRDGDDYPEPYKGDRKILMIAADERYLPTDNGRLFSTGNHPVETLLPMHHMHKAGFEFDVATVSGNPVKFELWAMPREDKAITGLHEEYLDRFQKPHKLSDIADALGPDSDYIAVFIPGGHGALMSLPESAAVAKVLEWALANDRHIVSICHGPAAFLAPTAVDGVRPSPFKGYSICAFPDSVDRTTPDIGYMPGNLTWFFGEKLKELGVTIVNSDVTGATHQDRKVITGDSPFASNALGKLAAKVLLAEVAAS
ncbi:MAG: glyoxalase III HchA [Geminicoccaceae bacterium]